MNPYLAEFLGTAILILLGNGVVANVVLEQTKGAKAGWIVITAGWALGVFTGVMCVGQFSGAHLNPAVTVALAVAGTFAADQVAGYIAAQMAGAFVGAVLVYLFYKPHFDVTADQGAKLATFCTGPAIRNLPNNFFCEAIGTFVLIFAVLLAADPKFEMGTGTDLHTTVKVGMGSLGAVPVAFVVFAIGLSLGGTTGYAINPARDLGPRIAHAVLPIANKGSSDWGYAPIPVLGPLVGGVAAAVLKTAIVSAS
ncbi:MAG: MIP/aquaporin family protein [Planctomycetaceae bacterium]|nr:MIP/aquaporin family protein [Planctomycetaceae bacterium]